MEASCQQLALTCSCECAILEVNPQPQPSLQMTASLAGFLTVTSWGSPTRATQLSCSQCHDPQKPHEIIHIDCCFKMLHVGVVCYIAIDYRYIQEGKAHMEAPSLLRGSIQGLCWWMPPCRPQLSTSSISQKIHKALFTIVKIWKQPKCPSTLGMDGEGWQRRGKEKQLYGPGRPAKAWLEGNQRKPEGLGSRAAASGTGKMRSSEHSPDGQMLHHPGVRRL